MRVVMTDQDVEPFVSAREIAQLLGVSVPWVYRAANAGILPAYRYDSPTAQRPTWRFRRSEVLSWARDHRSDLRP